MTDNQARAIEAGHTAGEWKWRNVPYEDGTPYIIITAGDGCYYDCGGFSLAGIMREEDAALIASAPDLLAACIQLRKHLSAAIYGITIEDRADDALEAADAVIAKAKAGAS